MPSMGVVVVSSLLLFAATTAVNGLPTIYRVGEEDVAAPVMHPVSSTVIPLEDLPEFSVGIGFGLLDKEEKRKRPDNLKDIQLITAKNKHRFVAAAGVKELTKEQFQNFQQANGV